VSGLQPSPSAVLSRLVLCFAALLPLVVAAQPVPATPYPAEAFFMRPELSSPRLSPSGRWLAALVRGAPERNMLVAIDLENPATPQVLARFADVDIGRVQWVGDERLVFDTVDLQRGSGGNLNAPGLFSVARDGGALRQLVKLRGNPIVAAPQVGPDRRLDYNHVLLHVPRAPPGAAAEVIVGELRFDSRGLIEEVTPRRLDVTSGRTRSVPGDVPSGARRWLFDAVGEPRVAVTVAQGRTQVHWRAPGQDGWVVLSAASSLEQPWSPHSIDSAGSFFVTVPRGKGGTAELARFDFATGRPQPTSLVSAPGFDFDGRVVVEDDGDSILGFRIETDAETTAWLAPRMKALQTQIDERLPGRVNRLSCRRCSEDGMVVLVESFSDQDPGSVWVWRAADKKLSMVGRALRGLEPARMATVDFQTITTRDTRTMPVWLTRPPGAGADATRPAIVLVHGGPWVRGGHWRWQPMQQFLASRGYVVIEPEFRGSAGYGFEHFRAGWRQFGEAMQDDVADAVLWATKQKLIDPQRVCIAGASYGGYAALMGLVRHPELYRCGAAWVALTDPALWMRGHWWWHDDVSDEARKYSLPTLIGDLDKDAPMLQAISPVAQAARIKAPVLLAFGELDRRVPLNQGLNMRQALRDAGNEPEWITYRSEGHGWRLMENQLDFARRLEAFFATHLAPR